MALLHLLHGVRARWSPPLHLEVAHFNHGLREESEEEERFVTATCGALGLRAHVVRWAEGAGSGMQERAREWRRAESRKLLDGMLQQKGGGAGSDGAVSTVPAPAEALIATAHHADDEVRGKSLWCAEPLLLNVTNTLIPSESFDQHSS
jgi:tRNA(Ile)-lysidine synthase TilS/MesJ